MGDIVFVLVSLAFFALLRVVRARVRAHRPQR